MAKRYAIYVPKNRKAGTNLRRDDIDRMRKSLSKLGIKYKYMSYDSTKMTSRQALDKVIGGK